MAAALAAASLGAFAFGVAGDDELLPNVVEPVTPVAGAAPIALVPVEGVVLPRLPGVAGPDSVPDATLEPVEFVPAIVPVVGAPGVGELVPLEPSVLDPSVDELLVAVPHGLSSGGFAVCASAVPAAATATAAAANRCAIWFMVVPP